MANKIGEPLLESMPALGTPGPDYATQINDTIAEIQDRLDDKVDLTSLADQADNTLVGRVGAGSTGAPTAVPLATVVSAIPAFAVGQNGIVTGPVSATGKFLRDDNTFQVPTVDLSSYLTIASAESIYLTQANADSTYLTQATASADYASYDYIAGQGYAVTGDLALKANASITVTGTGALSGGGDLTANRTIDLATQAAGTVMANTTGGAAVPTGVTYAALSAAMPLATTSTKGVVQLSGNASEVLTGTGWAAGGGGGGGLSAADVPDDIVGSFDAGQHLEILKAYSIVTPPTDALALVRPDNRSGLAIVNQYGASRRLMRDQSEVMVRRWQAQYGVAGAMHYPYAANASTGTGSTESAYVPVQGSTRLAALPRIGYRTGTSAGSVMYIYNTQYHSGMPKADSSTGGFYIKLVVPRVHLAAVSSERAFVGMVTSGSVALYNAAYETIANHIGFVRKAGSDTVYLSYRGPTLGGEIDLTAVNANLTWAGTVASPRGLVFILETLREAPNKVYYEIYDIDNEAASKVTGVLSVAADNLPADNLPLTWMLKSCNNTDAAAVSVYLTLVDLENLI